MRGFSFLSRQRKGFLLLEVLIGIALLSAFIGGVSWVMLNGQQSTDSAIDRQRAAYLAEAGLEVARTIRDKDFSLLTVGGPYGYQLTSGTWELAGTETIQDGYSTRLVIEPISIGKRVKVTATTTWKFGNKRGGTVALSTELSNWRVQRQFGDWTIPGVDGSWAPGGPVGFTPTSNHWPIVASFLSLFRASHADAQVAAPAFRDVIAVGKYAYATTATTPGIYIFDISTTSAPVRISTAVSLPFGLIGDKMKLASDGTIYMIAKDPSTMQSVILQFNAVASPVFTTAYDFDGFAVNALSLDSHIDTAGRQMLYVGTKYSLTSQTASTSTSSTASTASTVSTSSVSSSALSVGTSAGAVGQARTVPVSYLPVAPPTLLQSLVPKAYALQMSFGSSSSACGTQLSCVATGGTWTPGSPDPCAGTCMPAGSAASASSVASAASASSTASSLSAAPACTLSYGTCAINTDCCSASCQAGVCVAAAAPADDTPEFWAVHMPAGGLPGVTMSTLQFDGDINGVSVAQVNAEFVATLATSHNLREYTVVDAANSNAVAFRSGMGVDIHSGSPTDGSDGLAILTIGTGSLVGLQNDASTEELAYMDLKDGAVPPVSPSHISLYEMGGDLRSVDQDPMGCYAWLATGNLTKKFQIWRLKNRPFTQLALPAALNTAVTNNLISVHYSPEHDRAFLVTDDKFLVVKPGGPTNSDCQL